MSRLLAGTVAEEPAFLAIFNRLCVALREPQDDTGITQGVYWDALRDLSLEALQEGATALSRQTGRRWFPTTAEWRGEAERAQTEQLKQALPSHRAEPWSYDCHECEDTGWLMGLTCDGGATCGRKHKHLPHNYTRACRCRATNRTYLRHQAFGGGAA